MTEASSCAAAPAGVPAEVTAWVAAGRVALAAGEHAEEWGAAVRRAVLAEVDRVERLAMSLRAALVTAERAAGTWALRGDRDLAGFLGRESHQGRGAGFAAVGQAETLSAMPAVADALVDGPVTPRHLQEITRAAAASPRLAEELASTQAQAKVLELARRFDAPDFGRQLKAMSASLDPVTRQRQHDEQRAARFLVVSHTPGGALIKGALDSVAGYKVQKMLDAFSPRPAADDDRTREQRQADALMVAVERALADGATTPGAHAPVEAVVTLTEETWSALRRPRAAGSASAGSADDLVSTLEGADPVLDETRHPWPASEIGRALCDCALTRAVVDAFGQVLDLGRAERLFQRRHWLALLAAGVTTCAWPGCGMPLRYTELHHLAWWDRDGGRTSLANCAPYCSFHHHEIHRRDVAVTRRADGSYEHRHRDGRLIGPAPGGHAEPQRAEGAEVGRPPDAPHAPDTPSAHPVAGGGPPRSALAPGPPRGGPPREGPAREGPPSAGPSREGPSRSGSAQGRSHPHASGPAEPPDDLLSLLPA